VPDANIHNIEILKACIADFAAEDLLLVVEFLTYRLDGEDPAAYQSKTGDLVEGGARICLERGAKLLKIPYPGSAQACARITGLAGDVPWAVLSAGVDHATFLAQVEIAMANGASGVIAGRALWKDCISLDRAVTRQRLTATAIPRLRELEAVLAPYAKGKVEA
jgi:tagatose 1,6-diphosphate aldolase